MRYNELLEAPGQPVYHATKAENLGKIMQKGLTFFNPSLWVRADNPDERYQDAPGVFAFENPMPAWRWANKIEWEYKTKAVIIKLKWNDAWETDPSPDFMMTMGDGRALISYQVIPASDIIGAITVDQIGTPVSTGLVHDEFDKHVVDTLQSL
jgi:hypothetical protein